MKNKIITPRAKLEKFTCPHCYAISGQLWNELAQHGIVTTMRLGVPIRLRGTRNVTELENGIEWLASECENCGKICLWRNGEMIYPSLLLVDEPNEDLPEDIRKDYLEASSIVNKSPRGAAALLRLCIQKLCKYLGKEGKDLNGDIAKLEKEGLSEKVIKAMDALRVTGNNAVHPGELDISDNVDVAIKLFGLVNFIAEKMITEPKEIDSFYENVLPETAKKAIKNRSKEKK